MKFSVIKLSKALEDEIKFVQDIFSESADEGETLSRNEALRRIIEDSDELNHYAHTFVKELNELQISLGILKPMSQKDLDNTYVTRGKKYDLKYKGIYYKFDNWKPLENLTEKPMSK